MQKFILPIAVLILISCSCSNRQTFIIEGKVPNPEFLGSKVFLVALDAPVTKNVDSTVIDNGKFTFRIKADSFAVKILRIPAKFPHIIEDLVSIPEPGKINVVLDSISSGRGTRLNDILQQYKERKRTHDSIQWALFIQKKAAGTDTSAIDSLAKFSKKIDEILLSDNICMLNENLFNGIGLLIYKIYFDALPSSEKNYVTQMTGKKYVEKDAQLKKRFYN
jgi:hypothetical protein